MEGLAYIGKVIDIQAIPDADSIVAATVICGRGGKWRGVVRKSDIREGDLVRVVLQDAILPPTPEFAFLEKVKYRIRMMRLRGAPSECLILTTDILGNIGDDITEIMGVTRYEKPLPANVNGETYGPFPPFIPKTDEPNFQRVPHLVDALRGLLCYVTVKVDGTSTTAYKYRGHFGICSRNLEKKESDENALWQLAKQYKVNEWLPEGVALQWETAGPGIQKNPLGLEKVDAFVFDACYIEEHRHASLDELSKLTQGRMPMVPIIERGHVFSMSDDKLLQFAEGQYDSGKEQEGIVVRPLVPFHVLDERVSFKVINLRYRD